VRQQQIGDDEPHQNKAVNKKWRQIGKIHTEPLKKIWRMRGTRFYGCG
jgi:hypothetical protein